MRTFTALLLCLSLVPLAAACDGEDPVGPGGDNPGAVDAAVRAAVFLGSCAPDDGINIWLNRIYTKRSTDYEHLLIAQSLSCFEGKANGCQAVEDCVGLRVTADGPCEAACNGDVLESCDDALHFTIDCTKAGLTCSVDEGCIAAQAPACDSDTYTPSCTDGAPHICGVQEHVGPDCVEHGLVCGTHPELGYVACMGAGPACAAEVFRPLSIELDQGIACDGDTLRACVNGGEHSVACGEIAPGFTCQTGATGARCGLGTACEPGVTRTESCDGDSVVICNAGRIDKVDCTALGFTGCDPQTGYCIPSVYSDL